MKKWILGIVCLVSSQLLFSQTIKDGLLQLESENVAAAKKTFREILNQDSKNVAAWFYLGQIAHLDDQLDSANWYFGKVRELAPDNYYTHVGTGILQLEQKKVAEAEKSFAKAKKSVKSNELPVVLGLIGAAYLQSNHPQLEMAAQAFLEARNLDNKTARYFVGYGDAMLAAGKVGDALSSYEMASNKDKDNPEILMKIARAYYKNGVVDVAIEQLEAGIARFPKYPPAYKELYQLYFQKGQYAKVTPLMEKYVSLVGSDVEQRARLVKFLCFQAKDYKKAIAEAKIVLQNQPENYAMYRWLAWANFESGDAQAAFDASNQFFKLVGNRPVYATDYEYYARAAAKLNKSKVAVENFKKVVELDNTRTDVYEQIAKAYYDSKSWTEAEAAYLDKLSKGKPSNQDWYYLGMSQYQQGKSQEAADSFMKLTEIQPTYATGWLMLARSNNRLDPERKSFQAKPFYEKYIALAGAEVEKNKKQLVESYNYLGYFLSQNDDLSGSIAQYEKSLSIDPTNEEAKKAIEQLKAITDGK